MENPSTGYNWIIDKEACSEDLVQIQSEFKDPEPPVGLDGPDGEPFEYAPPGTPGTMILTITATGNKTGTCEFRMAYARPWEFNWYDAIDYANDKVKFDITVE